ncbi:MAG: hypothetical protein WAM14_15390 [Candidatus Nitrosopolaris sp.]
MSNKDLITFVQKVFDNGIRPPPPVTRARPRSMVRLLLGKLNMAITMMITTIKMRGIQ